MNVSAAHEMSRSAVVNSTAHYSPIDGVEMKLGKALGGEEAQSRLEIKKCVLELGFMGSSIV